MPDNIYTLGGINYDQSTRQGRVGFRQAARDQRKRNRMSIADGNLSDEEIIDLQDENKLLRGQSMQAGYDALQSATNGLGAGLISSGANFVNDMLESTLGSPAEYEGDKGHITQGLNEAYDAASDAAMKMGPIGMIVGGAMKGVKALGTGLDAITGGATGTSGMTTADAILGSNWLKLTPIGLVNSLGGSTTDTITRDEEAFGTVGSSYGGTGATVDDAVSKSGKKYGLFSTGKRKEADALIDEADRQQDIMSDIADEEKKRQAIVQSGSAINANRRQLQLQGGIQQANMRRGKFGMSIELIDRTKRILSAKEGTKVEKEFNIDDIKNRFPITKQLDIVLEYDPEFNPGYNLDYIPADLDSVPYHKKNTLGKSVIVYNDKADAEDIALDLLSHGLREKDSYWRDTILPSLHNNEVWYNVIADDSEYLNQYFKLLPKNSPYRQMTIEQFSTLNPEDQEIILKDFRNSEVYKNGIDGLIRALLVKDELRESKRYNYPSEVLDKLRDTKEWQKALKYINEETPQFKNGGTIIKESVIIPVDIIDFFQDGGSIVKETVITPIEDIDYFQDGGTIIKESVIIPVDDIEIFKEGGSIPDSIRDFYKDYNLDSVVVLEGDPRTEGDTIYVNTDEDIVHELWHWISQNKPNPELEYFYKDLNDDRIQELGGDLQFVKRTGNPGDFYDPSEIEARLNASKYQTRGQNYTKEFFQNLRQNEDQYGYNMRDLLHMYNDDNLVKLFNATITKFQAGGSINVIPEGALHARKHNMEMDGITKKGIPVISETPEGEIEQQAEIERSEIIYRLEVTQEIERLCKIYYDEDSSQKEKDQAALDAGKLLVQETLYNTKDNTEELL